MLKSSIPFIPQPTEMKVDNQNHVKIIDMKKIFMNFQSNRIESAIRRIFNQIFSEKQGEIFEIISNDKLDWRESYPIGKYWNDESDIPLGLYFMKEGVPVDFNITDININDNKPEWTHKFDIRDYQSTDEYFLIIDETSKILSRSERGIFYGLQTLCQILKFGKNSTGNIDYFQIHDTPHLSTRGIHIDLKRNRPNYDYLQKLTEDFGYYKVNTILCEWEDKFPFEDELEVIRHPAYLSKEEKDKWLTDCYNNYIEVIPLIQSLGHFEYVCKIEKFQHLREMHNVPIKNIRDKKEQFDQMCPLRAEAKELILKIHDQIMDGMQQHKSSHFVHIGMDETRFLGRCPDCIEFTNKHGDSGRSKLYINHLNWIGKYHLDKGKIPIAWCDMLIVEPELNDAIDKRIIINDWEYQMPSTRQQPSEQSLDLTGRSTDFVRTWESMGVKDLEKKNPPSKKHMYKKYWLIEGEKYPLRAFPHSYYFKDRGHCVIASSAVQSGRSTTICPEYHVNFYNIYLFNKIADEIDLMGSICTNWTIRNSAWPMLNYGFFLQADSAWQGAGFDPEEFKLNWWVNYFGLPLTGEGMIEKDSLSHIKNLKRFFFDLGKVGVAYCLLEPKLSANIEKKGFKTSPKEILNLCEKILPNYENELKILLDHATSHQKSLDFFLLIQKYLKLLLKTIKLIKNVEEIGIILDDEDEVSIPCLEDQQDLLEKLKIQKDRLNKIQTEFHESLSQILASPDDQTAMDNYFKEISLDLNCVLLPFESFVERMEEFVGKMIEKSINRMK